MSARRRLPLATLARASGSRRRTGRGRVFVVIFVLVAVAATGFWYLRMRPAVPEPAKSADNLTGAAGSQPTTTAADSNDPATTPTTDTDAPAPAPLLDFSAPSSTETTTPPASTDEPAETPSVEPPTPPPTVAASEPVEKDFQSRLPRDVFEAQVALSREAMCPGAIDGAWGSQTRNAVAAFQEKHGLRVTGQLDNPTRNALKLRDQPLKRYVVTQADIERLRPWPKGWLARSELDRMDYSTVLELVAERHFTHPNHIKRLNPSVDWSAMKAGTSLIVPNISRIAPSSRPEFIIISLNAKTLQLYDAESHLLAHFPCSIARRVEKRPVGELTVVTVAKQPNYTFNPETFPDSPDAQKVGRKLILQPGPNNPVGTAWIGLSVGEGSYGIHGSPEPEQIGRTESSGCFRLANWNVEYLVALVRTGMLVRVEP